MKTLISACLMAVICSGCSSIKEVDANKWAKEYYNQPRVADMVTIRGKGMSITLTNVDEMKISTIMPAISVVPKEQGIMDSLMSAIPNIGMAALAYHGLSQKPTIVNQPEPMVLRPEIVRP